MSYTRKKVLHFVATSSITQLLATQCRLNQRRNKMTHAAYKVVLVLENATNHEFNAQAVHSGKSD